MSLLIRGAQVVDGLGAEPYKADVLVQQNIISAIGNLKGREADTVIDGRGNYLTPGFVDLHSTSDHYLSIFDNPAQEDFLNQGVTTMLGGHCGGSLAPLLYGELDSLDKWGNTKDFNVDWHTVTEFREALSRVPLGVNFGTLVGYNTIRYALTQGRVRITPKEFEILKEILSRAMEDGAFGLSTGLTDVYNKRIPKKEIIEMVKVLKEFGGVYTTHLRSEEDEVLDAVQEAISVSEQTGVTTIISHLRPIKKFEKEYRAALREIKNTDAPVYFDTYPHPVSVGPIYTLLPEWAQVEGSSKMLKQLDDNKTLRKIKEEWGRINAESIKISGAPNREYLTGKTLKEIAEDNELDSKSALVKIMRDTGLQASVAVSDVDEGLLLRSLEHDRALITSHGNAVLSGEFMRHTHAHDSFPRYISWMFDERGYSFPHIIERITSRPARFMNLSQRGVIEEGFIADLVVVGKSDHEIRDVIVGGKLFREGGTRGSVLMHKK